MNNRKGVKVRQLKDYDCALACMAMAMGVKYDKAMVEQYWGKNMLAVVDKAKGLHGAAFFAALDQTTLSYKYTAVMPQYGSYTFLRFMLWGRRALLQVNSMNERGAQHLVYWDGRELYDPSNLNKYESLEETEPTYVIIFDECA